MTYYTPISQRVSEISASYSAVLTELTAAQTELHRRRQACTCPPYNDYTGDGGCCCAASDDGLLSDIDRLDEERYDLSVMLREARGDYGESEW